MFAQKKGDLPLICPARTITWKIISNPSDPFDFIWGLASAASSKN
jgi:hypothetical protein